MVLSKSRTGSQKGLCLCLNQMYLYSFIIQVMSDLVTTRNSTQLFVFFPGYKTIIMIIFICSRRFIQIWKTCIFLFNTKIKHTSHKIIKLKCHIENRRIWGKLQKFLKGLEGKITVKHTLSHCKKPKLV